ncbi:MAG: hypothetical protein JSV52_06275 [Candidatus Zixiibacteriota bacterium]|nr:MAG: hypothetical protein JSV52_06275 [candidate division Zixibacteria bacterium]
MVRICACIILLNCLVMAQTADEDDNESARSGSEAVMEYIDLVASDNYESAIQYWTEESRHRSSRFGIEYTDIPFKIDCTSPIVRNPGAELTFGLTSVTNMTELASEDYLRYTHEVTINGEEMKYYYYTQVLGGYHWLIFPQDYHARDWAARQTKYFNIRYPAERGKYLNQIVLDEADNFIERTARAIGLSVDDLRLLEKEKIEYIYCDSDYTVRDIIDHMVMGTYDLASDDIISAFFPHYHELTHFLVNFKLRRLDMYTLPVFREGLAVFYGGRWGKTPTAMLTLGGYLHRGQVVLLDSIMTLTDFDANAGSDLAYPLAALLVGYLIEKSDRDSFLELYRQMSGGFDKVYGMAAGDIESVIASRVGVDSWSKLKKEFDDFVNRWVEQKAGVFPGSIDGGEVILESRNLVVSRAGDWVGVTASFPNGQVPNGNLLFGHVSEGELQASTLFDEQYQHQLEFENYRFGIRFDQFEVGLYDYATNEILAKYIWGMAPSESYYDKDQNRITFKFKSDISRGTLPSPQDYLILEK